ncbi:hypothetical protein C8A01DRAFT_19295 [Parachaetomium inaequale]|uniref:Phosphoglycerate mutase n=1 Tax=Parachaetomium inaequale TaxID=2588326 RepID=A0AAN6P8P9_9PEZI|nr:hypothetical protein C8A01DRAFT_19295 [Parachaetomium inaequale]
MGRPPAYLFVVRHGYRLDAADKQWHLSSPTPYDPPLTYSGWQQAKSLGARIASIIRERVVQDDEHAASHSTDPSSKPKRKRYEVVLHSSPFLRCIQTSIAISAGLAQDSAPFGPRSSQAASPAPAPTADGRPRPTVVTDMRDNVTPAAGKIRKCVLRLDAFLGEWLSPNYFEFITPPPESVMMLASAKADLLRREDYTHYPNFVSHTHSNSQGQLWSPIAREMSASPSSGGQSNGFGPLVSMGPSPSPGSSTSARSDQQAHQGEAGYVSPVPHYAISNNNNIPQGYVSHARDACTIIDYQWHSTRSMLDWGDGGTFPEEWAAMHKRFRAGVQSLVDWYSTAEAPTRPVTKTVRTEPVEDSTDDEEDVETESIVIMVSHGAGCNALIGAITHQPVLMDVAMASLTMAVRKPSIEDSLHLGGPSDTPPVHELYDLKLFANTDHLRSPSATPTSSRSPALAGAMNGIRARHSSFSTSSNGFSWNDGFGSRNSSATAAPGGFRKSPKNDSPVPRLSFAVSTGGITVGSGVTSFPVTRPSNLGRTGSSGLWSPIATPFEDDEEDDAIPVLNFGGYDKPAAAASTPTPAPVSGPNREPSPLASNGNNVVGGSAGEGPSLAAERSPKPEPEQLGAGTGGLWGTPRPPDDADRFRDLSGSKRRWTVTERS